MKRSFINTLILTLVFGGLIAWYLVYEKKVKPKQTEQEERSKQLIMLDKNAIQELVLIRQKDLPTNATPEASAKQSDKAPEYLTIKLVKTGGDWNLVEPIQDQTDTTQIAPILGTLTSTHHERVVDDNPKDLSVFGLKYPRFKVIVRKDSTSPAQEVWIGSDTPVGSAVYAKTAADNKVYKMPSSFKIAADKDVKTLRNKSILNVPRFDVGEVEIQNSKGGILLKKGDKDQWLLTRENIPADNNEVNKIVNAVVDLRATEFVSEDGSNLAKYGLTSPKVKVWLTKAKDGKGRVGFLVGQVKDKVYVKREDKKNVYEVDKDFIAKVDKSSADLRSLELANFNRFDTKRIKIEQGKDVIELFKEKTDWSFPTEPATKVDNAKVDAYLAKLQDARIQRYLPGKANIQSPRVTIRVFEKKDAGEVEKVTLKLGNMQGNMVQAQRVGIDLPLLIKEEDFKKLKASKSDFMPEEKKPEDKKAEDKAAVDKQSEKKS